MHFCEAWYQFQFQIMVLVIPCLMLHFFRNIVTLLLGTNGGVLSYEATETLGTSERAAWICYV